VQERRFHAWLWKEELGDSKTAIGRTRHGRREDVGAGSTREARRLRVDVSDAARIRVERRQRDDVLAHRRAAIRRGYLLETPRQVIDDPRSGSWRSP
jgi:hypothetical protein